MAFQAKNLKVTIVTPTVYKNKRFSTFFFPVFVHTWPLMDAVYGFVYRFLLNVSEFMLKFQRES